MYSDSKEINLSHEYKKVITDILGKNDFFCVNFEGKGKKKGKKKVCSSLKPK